MTISIIEQIVRLFAPHLCLGCGVEEDKLLCELCTADLPPVPSRCYRCKAATECYKVCVDCVGHTPLSQVAVRTYYQGLTQELVHRMKYERAQAGIYEVAALLAPLLPVMASDAVVAQIPTATSRVRARGYDHARLLARATARHGSLPCRTLLSRMGQAHQVGASRVERLKQLQGTFRPVHAELIKGRHIMLIDDVLTTGATLEAAAHALKRAGARSVSAIVFAEA